MPDIYLIGDTIRFTAIIKNMDGEEYDPSNITVSVFKADGTELLSNAEAIKKEKGSYYYDWKVEGTTENTNLIAVSYTHLTLPTIYSV